MNNLMGSEIPTICPP